MHIDEAQLNFQGESLWLLNIILGVIMFGIAIDLKSKDFRALLDRPRAPIIGLFGQFLLLPALTFALVWALRPAPSVALGMMLVAACPGGNLSNFLAYLGRGNAALSVGMTMISTLAALVMTPFNLAFWARLYPDTAAILLEVRLEPFDVFLTVSVILGVPLLAGLAFARRFPRAADRLHTPFKIGGVGFFLAFLAMVFSQNTNIFLDYVGWVGLAVVLQNALALGFGYGAARLARLPVADCRAICMEVGIQNSALALSLIFAFFGGIGGMAVVAGFWGIWHIMTGMALALFWSRRPQPDAPPQPCTEAA